jgi:hypothetical protein
MDIEDDDLLPDDNDEVDSMPSAVARLLPGSMDPRRVIERLRELRQLREQLDDPEFSFDFD